MLASLALHAGFAPAGEQCSSSYNASALVHLNNSGHTRTPAKDMAACCAQCISPSCAGWSFDGHNPPCKLSPYPPFLIERSTNKAFGGGTVSPSPLPAKGAPNIVFLVVESTDGRTWSPGYQNDVIPLPNIRKLQHQGFEFRTMYANAPVCCPSRATFWSGRHAHHIPHMHGNVFVGGAWNNYEGLPKNFSDRIDQVLQRVGGYNVGMFGKTDWTVAGHGESPKYTDLALWTMYTGFPYNISADGGWADESGCKANGTVSAGGSGGVSGSAHAGDWKALEQGVAWVQVAAKDFNTSRRPFFAYQGMNIVHPPYATSEYWYEHIDPAKIEVPAWPSPTRESLEALHPCDLQSSMLKGCLPALDNLTETALLYSTDRRRRVRRIYAAMIAEFDAMVGAWMEGVEKAGVWDNTVWIVTSDHGDMQMEHQQWYKMTPYDASARVPMVFFDPRSTGPSSVNSSRTAQVVAAPTQLIDIYPTVMELAKVESNLWPAGIDGHSLLPLMQSQMAAQLRRQHINWQQRQPEATETEAPSHSHMRREGKQQRPNFVVSQFHGKNLAMSWFLVVQPVNGTTYKLILWGTGKEVPSMLYDLDADPQESNNLIPLTHPSQSRGWSQSTESAPKQAHRYQQVLAQLQASLSSVVDYSAVAQEVAQYNKDIFTWWMSNATDWRGQIAKDSNAETAWQRNSTAAFEAVDRWLSEPAKVVACRGTVVWPPSKTESKAG